jgi:hypothetical protein
MAVLVICDLIGALSLWHGLDFLFGAFFVGCSALGNQSNFVRINTHQLFERFMKRQRME